MFIRVTVRVVLHVGSGCLNLNSLLVKRQIDNPSPGAVTGGNQSLALTREVNLDTLSSDSSEEEIWICSVDLPLQLPVKILYEVDQVFDKLTSRFVSLKINDLGSYRTTTLYKLPEK